MFSRRVRAGHLGCISCIILLSIGVLASAAPPQVARLVPENGATDVDPSTTELMIVFDQNMQTQGMSICGGGPTFPKTQKSYWKNARTLVMRVTLEPDHAYTMSLNCSASDRWFRNTSGEELPMTPWEFSTTAAGAGKLSQADQRKLNSKALKELMKTLRKDYSYYKLRKIDWKKLEKKHRKAILAADGTQAWISEAAKMLSAAKDVHMWFDYKGALTGTFQRNIRPNVKEAGVRKVLPNLTQRNDCIYTAKTDDNIGYMMIVSLAAGKSQELAEAAALMAEFKDCEAMVIDLRPNSGGAEPLAMPIAAWFIDGEKLYAKHVYRDADAESGFSAPSERKIKGNEPPNRFNGPLAVLTGRAVMSSCEAFVLMLKQGRDVTIVGDRTYGSSGNPKPHTLCNGVDIYLPSWKAMTPDGKTFEGKGIPADVRVRAQPAEFEAGDPVLKKALELLRQRTH